MRSTKLEIILFKPLILRKKANENKMFELEVYLSTQY